VTALEPSAACAEAAPILGTRSAPDDLSITRLRRVLTHYYGEVPHLDAHLRMLDSRGVTYATHVAEHFADQSPRMLFGLVRHVVRTHCPHDPPDPDVEGWLTAGRPAHDLELAETWDLLNHARYSDAPLDPQPRAPRVDPAIERFDAILGAWPEHPAHFAMTYCRLEWFIEARGIQLPPIRR
jgi:hypothetical protein